MSKSKLVTQVDLVDYVDKSHIRQMTTWLDADPRIKVGTVLSLKDVIGKWKIVKVYDTVSTSDIDKRGWDNNNYDKHEGLFK